MSFSRRIELATWNGGQFARFRLLKLCANLLVPVYRLKFPQLEWWHDTDFNNYLDKFSERRGHNSDRRWIIHQLLRLTAEIAGDTAECGVYAGASSYVILKANQRDQRFKRTHFMFDSYEGLSKPNASDGSYWRAGDLAIDESTVDANLTDCRDYKLMKGWIPTRFSEVADRQFSFVHIDVDLYEPTRDSIAFFLPRMSPGGIIVVDDYWFTTCPGATQGVDEVLAGSPEKMLALPDGGGFLIKGVSTGRTAKLMDPVKEASSN